jgi:V/A-type H+-transporting ATPase subunit F
LSRLVAIAPSDSANGYRLTGIEVFETESAAEASKEVLRLLEDETVAMLLLSESLAEEMDNKTISVIEESSMPLVLVVPEPSGWEEVSDQEAYVGELIRRSIGYQIKITT